MDSIDYEFAQWGPYLSKMVIDKSIVDRLLEDGNELRKNWRENNHNKALAGQLENQYQYKKETNDWFWQAIIPYFRTYRYGHCNYFNLEYKDVTFKYDSLWVNYMKAGEFNPPHIHTSDLSFVLYLQVPEELKVERMQYEGTASGPGDVTFIYGEYNKPVWTQNANTYFPEVGQLMIFPALLQHHVCPFQTKGVERVSVSGNLNYIKTDWPNDYF